MKDESRRSSESSLHRKDDAIWSRIVVGGSSETGRDALSEQPAASSRDGRKSAPVRRKANSPRPQVRKTPSPRDASAARPSIRASAGRPRVQTPSSAASAAHRRGSAASPKPSESEAAPALWQPTLPNRATVGALFAGIASTLFSLVRRSRSLTCAVALVCLLGVVGVVDAVACGDKVHDGVSAGGIDLSGMTLEEATAALEESYAPRLEAASITIFADEDARAYVDDAIAQAQDKATAEQVSLDEARAHNRLWTATATSLGAVVPYDSIAHAAFAVGRSDGGLPGRVQAALFGRSLPVNIQFSGNQLEELAVRVDETVGEARIDANLAFADGRASAVEGRDGRMIDRAELADRVSEALLSGDSSYSFVAEAYDAPSRISFADAETLAAAVNEAYAGGVEFSYADLVWNVDAAQLIAWSKTEVVPDGSSWRLAVSLDGEAVKSALFARIRENEGASDIEIFFEKEADGSIAVRAEGAGPVPYAAHALEALEQGLFGDGGRVERARAGARAAEELASALPVTIEQGTASDYMTFDEARDIGIVGVLGTYTTSFSTYSGTESRNHNIALASELLDGSIVEADGGRWSFNSIAGFCNEERGFLTAGTIADGEYADAIGGGICQVATTIFNAVFEAGLPVDTRHNHTLYIASYPAGRDAAVSWPDLDLVWSNDTKSDIYLDLSLGESTLTATLYGSPLGYTVSADTGLWKEGEKYRTRTVIDESLPADSRYVKTTGADGRSITVVRTVRDYAGATVRVDSFSSLYSAKDEVIMVGPTAS